MSHSTEGRLAAGFLTAILNVFNVFFEARAEVGFCVRVSLMATPTVQRIAAIRKAIPVEHNIIVDRVASAM